ncbi:MAG: hypothetical protein JO246_06455, partial [Frankiaceae bacterium]|nr:hypothetical protein [Frankiaceae bacterium]
MTRFDDDPDMKGYSRGDAQFDAQDAAVMNAAADALRPLTPDRAPEPSAQLAAMMASGIARPTTVSNRAKSLLARFAGLGAAAKVMLAAGVAVAGAGSAGVAYEVDHHFIKPHHSNHGDQKGPHHGGTTPRPTSSPTHVAPEPTEPETGDDHPGAHQQRGHGSGGSGSSDGQGGSRHSGGSDEHRGSGDGSGGGDGGGGHGGDGSGGDGSGGGDGGGGHGG